MFKRLFARKSATEVALCDAVYGQIVAAARQPALFADWETPDTPIGRFEMVALHMIIVLRRLSGQGDAAARLAQDLTDLFFAETDRALRDLGVGDTRVPKRMKDLAAMFFGRAKAYGDAIGAGDREGLAAALRRNVRPGAAAWNGAAGIAAYALACDGALADAPLETLLAGRVAFTPAATEE